MYTSTYTCTTTVTVSLCPFFPKELQDSLENASVSMQQVVTVNETRDSTSGMNMNSSFITLLQHLSKNGIGVEKVLTGQKYGKN